MLLLAILVAGAGVTGGAELAWAEAPQPLEGAAAIVDLNIQREANGIPPIVTVDQSFASTWCPEEDSETHAGEISRDWSYNDEWSTEQSPWTSAPLHQQSIYYPRYAGAGDVNVNSSACMGLGEVSPVPATPTFYDFVGERGPSDVAIRETVHAELPLAPQEAVGIPQGQTTGPDLVAYALGLGVSHSSAPEATSWSLVNAKGEAVPDVQMVDEEKMAAFGDPGYLLDDSIMIPPELAPLTTYTATINWRSGSNEQHATQSFTFTTSYPPPTIEYQRAYPEGASVSFQGRVNTNGVPTAVCYFAYGLTTTYGETAPCSRTTEGSTMLAVIATAQHLHPATTYHYQLFAGNAGGTTGGGDETFTTSTPLTSRSQEPANRSHRARLLLSGLRILPDLFHPAKGPGASIAAAGGAEISYSDSEPATSELVVLAIHAGVRRGRACKPSKMSTHDVRRHCTRLVRVGAFSHGDHLGSNELHFTGRVHGRGLTPGPYELRVIARVAGQDGASASTRFRIAK